MTDALRAIIGQEPAKRAIEIAAAGHHNTLLVGPAGCGKTMLVAALAKLLPDGCQTVELPTQESADGLAKTYSHLLTATAGMMIAVTAHACDCGLPDCRRAIPSTVLDHIDICIRMGPVPTADMLLPPPCDDLETVRKRVSIARQIQTDRQGEPNGVIRIMDIRDAIRPDADGFKLIYEAAERMHLSARQYDGVLRVARTIADMERSPTVRRIHVAEALSYRMVPSAPLISLDAIQSAYLAWFAGLSPNPDPACAGHPLKLMAEAVELCIAFGATPAQIVAVTYDELDKSHRRNDGADPDAVAGELADVVMNAFNVARIRGIDVASALVDKIAVNAGRGFDASPGGVLVRRRARADAGEWWRVDLDGNIRVPAH